VGRLLAAETVPEQLGVARSSAAAAEAGPTAVELAHVVGNRAFGALVARRRLQRQAPALPVEPPPRAPARPVRLGGAPANENVAVPTIPSPPPVHQPSESTATLVERGGIVEQERWLKGQLERPHAALDRGGRAPRFVTSGALTGVQGRLGMIRYTPRTFHVLSKIEYEVSRANTNEDLEDVLIRYLGRGTVRVLPPRLDELDIVWRDDLDPDGRVRTAIYFGALAKRIREVPALASAPAARRPRLPEESRRRGCEIVVRPVTYGGDPLAEVFCDIVTGRHFEAVVRAPDGGKAYYDALAGNLAFECKCGWSSMLRDLGSARAWARVRGQFKLDKIEKQMRAHQDVADQCGLNLVYIVSNQRVAEFLNQRWDGRPHVIWSRFDECN
jgi:hypothetical protein